MEPSSVERKALEFLTIISWPNNSGKLDLEGIRCLLAGKESMLACNKRNFSSLLGNLAQLNFIGCVKVKLSSIKLFSAVESEEQR